ncbi:MAG: nucleotide exchange factor GrpE [Spirochaetales bacterium]
MSDSREERKEHQEEEQTILNQETETNEVSAGEETLEQKLEAREKRIKELEEENLALKDQYLRKAAEFENFRKRMLKEKQEAIQFANRQLLLDLVHILDDFERAIQSAETSKDFDSFHEGILMIEKRLYELLERKWGLKRLESVGQPFDPTKHEAITSEERSDHEESIVLEDYQKGYTLHDRIIRTAKVKVSVPKATDTSEMENEQNTMADA